MAGDECLLIDDHGSKVRAQVWALYRHAIERCGAVSTLIEWDNNIPEWPVLLAQAQRAELDLRDRLEQPTAPGDSHAVHLG